MLQDPVNWLHSGLWPVLGGHVLITLGCPSVFPSLKNWIYNDLWSWGSYFPWVTLFFFAFGSRLGQFNAWGVQSFSFFCPEPCCHKTKISCISIKLKSAFSLIFTICSSGGRPFVDEGTEAQRIQTFSRTYLLFHQATVNLDTYGKDRNGAKPSSWEQQKPSVRMYLPNLSGSNGLRTRWGNRTSGLGFEDSSSSVFTPIFPHSFPSSS